MFVGTYRLCGASEVTESLPHSASTWKGAPGQGEKVSAAPPPLLSVLPSDNKLHCFFHCPVLIGPSPRAPIGCGPRGHAAIGPQGPLGSSWVCLAQAEPGPHSAGVREAGDCCQDFWCPSRPGSGTSSGQCPSPSEGESRLDAEETVPAHFEKAVLGLMGVYVQAN